MADQKSAAKSDSGASWLKRGDAGVQRAKEVADEREKALGPMRFFLKAGEEAKLVFLDSDGVFFFEHNLKNPQTGKWGYTFTCRSEIDNCPLCEAGHKPAYVCAHTVIDTRTYVDKRGRKRSFEKRLLISKQTVQNTLAKLRKKKGGLQYAVIEFTRSSSDEASTGETLDFEGKTTKEKILKKAELPKEVKPEDFLAPFKYGELFKPKSIEELEKVAGVAPPVGRESEGSEGASGAEEGGEGDSSIDDLI